MNEAIITFYERIGNVFALFLAKNDVKLPVILFVDGHNTHLTRETSEHYKSLQQWRSQNSALGDVDNGDRRLIESV